MTIEQKKLSDTEFLLFFSRPFPFRGTFYLTPETASVSSDANTVAPEMNAQPAPDAEHCSCSLPLSGTAPAAASNSNLAMQSDNTPMFLTELATSGFASELLLTESFMYLHSTEPGTAEDLETLALAEIDDYAPPADAVITAKEDYTETKIKIILKTIIATFLQKDGGDIEFRSFDNGTAVVRFLGKCQGCPYAQRTLKERVEKNLIRWLPQVREVVLQ